MGCRQQAALRSTSRVGDYCLLPTCYLLLATPLPHLLRVGAVEVEGERPRGGGTARVWGGAVDDGGSLCRQMASPLLGDRPWGGCDE